MSDGFWADVVCLGEALIDFVSTEPVPSVADAPAFVLAPGGSVANTAVGLARLGVSVAFIGSVGDDPFGQLLARTLRTNGVDVSGLKIDSEARTALAFVALDAAGHPDFVFFRHPSADMRLSPEDLDRGLIECARCLHTGSILLASEPSRSALLAGMEMASERGVIVSLDPNIRRSLWPDEAAIRRDVLPAIAMADILKLSSEDLPALLGDADVETAAKELLGLGPKVVVITRGREGVYARTAELKLSVPGLPVIVEDTTGCGDAFTAGFLRALFATEVNVTQLGDIDEWTLRSAVEAGNAAGALTATSRGAIPAMPTREELDEFMLASELLGLGSPAEGNGS